MFLVSLVKLSNPSDKRRYILLNEETRSPCLYPLLYVMSKLRLKSLSTQQSNLNALKFWYNFWKEKFSEDFCLSFYESKYSAEIFIEEIDSFFIYLENNSKYDKNLIRINKQVEMNYTTISKKIQDTIKYLIFLTDNFTWQDIENNNLRHNSNRRIILTLQNKLDQYTRISSSNSNVKQFKSLTKRMKDSFYEIILPSTPTKNNPKNIFKDNSTQFRNFLIVRLLINYGLRASELLLLSTKSIKLDGNAGSSFLVVCDTQDTKDYRSPKPNIKNEQSNRILQLSRDDYKLISYYTENHRPKNAKSDLLFLSLQSPFSPLSYSSIKKMFNAWDKQLRELYPEYYDSRYTGSIDKLSAHVCRHTWATLMLEYTYITAMNSSSNHEVAMSQAIEDLKKSGGWSSNSLMVSKYADRYLSERANTTNINRMTNHGDAL